MDDYIDEIRGYSQKLEAIGYHVDDDDLVFYALKGLPKEFRGVRSALNAKGDVLFDELAPILKNEESQIHKDEGIGTTKVFLTTQTQSQGASSSGTQVIQSGILGTVPQNYQVPMYQSQGSGSYYPAIQQSNRNTGFSGGYQNNGGFQRPRNGRGGFQNNRTECQICGKTNHTALYCYHRQNLQYQPYQNTQPQTQNSGQRRGVPQ